MNEIDNTVPERIAESEPITLPHVDNGTVDPQAQEIARLKAEIEQLKVEATEQVEQLKLQVAVANVKKGSTESLGLGKQDVKREVAIRAAGGPARWYAMSPDQRAAVLGATENVPEVELRKYFGNSSNGMDAQRLAKQNPAKYKTMRILARERGII